MTPDAVLYLASLDDLHAARLSVAGRPLAFRVVMAAVRAGARRIGVPAALRDAGLETTIARTPTARQAVEWLAAGAAPPTAPVLLLPAGTLVTAHALKDLAAAPASAVLAGSDRADAPVAAAAAPVVAPAWEALVRGEPIGTRVGRALAGAPEIRARGVVVRVPAAAAVEAAETRLLASLGSPIDTRLDRAVHRRLSAPITRWAVARGVSANAITVASIAVGLSASVAIMTGGVAGAIAGVLLYAAAVVLDHADGEVARVSFAESALGEWLDIGGDTAVHASLVLALGLAAQRTSSVGLALGVTGAAGVVVSAWVAKTAPPATHTAGRFFGALGNRNGFYAMLFAFVGALALLPAALPVLMTLVAAGTHAFWVGSVLARAPARPAG